MWVSAHDVSRVWACRSVEATSDLALRPRISSGCARQGVTTVLDYQVSHRPIKSVREPRLDDDAATDRRRHGAPAGIDRRRES